ncbi:muropeptide transporter [bacterium BMS3Bbin11]|nr:muropeptide transporter [bacterium BMS3Abin11]GBE46154.1 muropeptide transporter [bacterium BMS3Bbin11]GMT39464.1 MAG: MFS transporter [bacterium]HDH15928.1 MFS transporter [Gammaproteobacteria bacterium]HDZ78204.1 MFS transporter [Gammaproteobacteria bacterium]
MTKDTLHNWKASFQIYKEPKVLAMLFLGFSAGLPILLVFGTLSAWLNSEGINKTTIGFVSWVALAYGLKFIWSPLVDRLPLPLLTNILGQRRSWMLLAQTGVIAGLLALSMYDPKTNLTTIVVFAVLTAFSSATQDITIDAWRIEAIDEEYQGAMAGTYQLGYRIGMILAGSMAFVIADFYSWSVAYQSMALFMIVGIISTFIISEPDHTLRDHEWETEERVISLLERKQHLPEKIRNLQAWFVGAVICPFADFFARNGWNAILILSFIAVFRMSDITLGVMAFPFYQDMGYSGTQIGLVSGLVGKFITISGALIGGILVVRYGVMRMLMAGAIIVIATNLLYAWLAGQQPLIIWLILVVGADNLAGGFAGTVFIAYLSSLTNRAYTATQYALFSSIMLLLPKFIGGFSGVVVDTTSYPYFFLYAASLGIPSIILILILMKQENKK